MKTILKLSILGATLLASLAAADTKNPLAGTNKPKATKIGRAHV